MGVCRLSGLDGSNPLAFLAALGTFRVLDAAWPTRDVRLHWLDESVWTPELAFSGEATRDEVVAALVELLGGTPPSDKPSRRSLARKEKDAQPSPAQVRRKAKDTLKKAKKAAEVEGKERGLKGAALRAFVSDQIADAKAAADEADAAAREHIAGSAGPPQYALDDVIGVPGSTFREFALRAVEVAHGARDSKPGSCPDWSGFVASYGSEAVCDKDGRVSPTPLSFLNGAGGKCLLKTCRELAASTTAMHITRSLFETWTYQDERLALRWDPADDRRYALRWGDPSADARTEWGAGRVAVEALPLFPCAPTRAGLVATGWRPGRQGLEFTWPIWQPCLSISVVQSLLGLEELSRPHPNRAELEAMGVREVFRASRAVVGKNVFFSGAVPAPGE